MCAAPGGKTLQLAAAGAQRHRHRPFCAAGLGSGVTGEPRADRTFRAAGCRRRRRQRGPWTGRSFDAILLDAPCSATGTFRHHPDVAVAAAAPVRHQGAWPALQKRSLIARAVALLKSRAERWSIAPARSSRRKVNRPSRPLLATESGMRRVPVEADEVAGLREILTANGDLRTLPCHLPHTDPRLGGLDGFYAARLVKS